MRRLLRRPSSLNQRGYLQGETPNASYRPPERMEKFRVFRHHAIHDRFFIMNITVSCSVHEFFKEEGVDRRPEINGRREEACVQRQRRTMEKHWAGIVCNPVVRKRLIHEIPIRAAAFEFRN